MLTVINGILVIGAIAYLVYLLVMLYMRKTAARVLDSQVFGEDLRHVQLIDIREKDEFKANHILGARNIPSSQFKIRYKELRKDQPVYLYDDGFNKAARAAFRLKRAGYSDIAILKGGFEYWNGKIKKG